MMNIRHATKSHLRPQTIHNNKQRNKLENFVKKLNMSLTFELFPNCYQGYLLQYNNHYVKLLLLSQSVKSVLQKLKVIKM